jgi:hypothetical protein
MSSAPNWTSRVLDCAAVAIEVTSNDSAVVEFVVEYFDPWFPQTQRAAEWRVTVDSSPSAYTAMQQQLPAGATRRPCFAHDQRVMSLPAWRSEGGLNISDADRSCFLRLRPGEVELIGNAQTRRWRFTLLWILQEIAATRLRQTHVDMHAAAVEHDGRALVIAGPKNAGKTTLSFYLMQAGWRSIANDRTFLSPRPRAVDVAGMPTAVKIRDATLSRFAELRSGLPAVARPYLYSLSELETARAEDEPLDAVGFFALTPNQIAFRLGADTCATARLGAIVFPQIGDDVAAWSIESLASEDIVVGIGANLYGALSGDRPATVFEDLGGGQRRAIPELIATIAAAAPGYCVRLGRDAYANGGLSEGLIRLLAA